MSLSALALTPVEALQPALGPPAASTEQIGKIRRTSHEFEAQLVSQMLQPMFEGLSTDGQFGGGQAEGTWRSFMVDAMGKQMAHAGGLGIAASVEREMLKMQGLSEPAAARS